MFFIVMVVRAVVEVGKFLDVGCARDASGRKTFRLMLDARFGRMENLYGKAVCAMCADIKVVTVSRAPLRPWRHLVA